MEKRLPTMRETWVQSLGREDLLEKGMATHASILASPAPQKGLKEITSLDSILKSRVITLPTKVHLVKAMVFPVVMYGCETWTIKKAEC